MDSRRRTLPNAVQRRAPGFPVTAAVGWVVAGSVGPAGRLAARPGVGFLTCLRGKTCLPGKRRLSGIAGGRA